MVCPATGIGHRFTHARGLYRWRCKCRSESLVSNRSRIVHAYLVVRHTSTSRESMLAFTVLKDRRDEAFIQEVPQNVRPELGVLGDALPCRRLVGEIARAPYALLAPAKTQQRRRGVRGWHPSCNCVAHLVDTQRVLLMACAQQCRRMTRGAPCTCRDVTGDTSIRGKKHGGANCKL